MNVLFSLTLAALALSSPVPDPLDSAAAAFTAAVDAAGREAGGTVGSCSNDAGILTLPDGTHLVLAVFVRGGRDAAARDETIARVARAAWQAFAT